MARKKKTKSGPGKFGPPEVALSGEAPSTKTSSTPPPSDGAKKNPVSPKIDPIIAAAQAELASSSQDNAPDQATTSEALSSQEDATMSKVSALAARYRHKQMEHNHACAAGGAQQANDGGRKSPAPGQSLAHKIGRYLEQSLKKEGQDSADQEAKEGREDTTPNEQVGSPEMDRARRYMNELLLLDSDCSKGDGVGKNTVKKGSVVVF